MRPLVYLLVWSAATFAASPPWLDAVAPLLKPGEKKSYLALTTDERAQYEDNFWTGKSISADEYFHRVQYIDAKFGSGRLGSGANTDLGRVYLSIGAPVRIRRIPSSRIFVPLEIWYYDTVPGLLNTELRLIFYQKNSQGFLKLYSPELDTIRALLLPQAATIDTFGPNDSVSEATLRMNLNVPPAEDEVITAAVNVATGIKYSGNGEIIGLVLSPSAMLTRDLQTMVQSKLISAPAPRPVFLFGKSPFDAVQLDMALEVSAQWEVQLEVMEGPVTVYQNRLALNFDAAQPIQYLHRLDLLPGSYRLAIRIDGKTSYHPLEVPAKPPVSEVVFASETPGGAPQGTPFEFNGVHLYPSPDGRFALIAWPQPSQVSWSIRRGFEVVWRQKTANATSVAVVPLPFDSLAPGKYQLEAIAGDETKRADLEIGPEIERKIDDKRTLVSFNANLTSTQRNAQVGHEYLLRGDTKRALPYLAAALRESPIKEVQVDLARVDALSERWDQARDRLRPILAADPMNFEALCVYAYIEAQLQDYQVAAEYFQRALAVQDSPTIRLTLSQLPR